MVDQHLIDFDNCILSIEILLINLSDLFEARVEVLYQCFHKFDQRFQFMLKMHVHELLFLLTILNCFLLFFAYSMMTRFESGNLSHMLMNFSRLIAKSKTGSAFSSKLLKMKICLMYY